MIKSYSVNCVCGGKSEYKIFQDSEEEIMDQQIISIKCEKCGLNFDYDSTKETKNDLFPIIPRQ